jgi:hypothetical protein
MDIVSLSIALNVQSAVSISIGTWIDLPANNAAISCTRLRTWAVACLREMKERHMNDVIKCFLSLWLEST